MNNLNNLNTLNYFAKQPTDNIYYAGTGASLDLNFAGNKSLMDRISGNNLVTFTRASSGTFVDSAGVLQTASTDVPRFDHNPTTGESLGLLVEEQRTNLQRHSEDFTQGLTPINATLTANQEIAPNGTLTADQFIETTANGLHSQEILDHLFIAGTTYTFSCYAKSIGGRNFAPGFPTRFDTARFGFFDLSGSGSVVGTNAGVTASIQAVGNGWYRCSITSTCVTGGGARVGVFIASGTSITYTGDSSKGLLLWGAQLEVGAFPTSYIPTGASAVTRSADIASITGTNFSSWYNQTEGTVFAEAINRETYHGINVFPYLAQVDDGTNNNRVSLDFSVLASGYRYNLAVASGGSAQFEIGPFRITQNSARWAAGFRSSDSASAISVSPGTVFTSTSGTLPGAMTQLRIGAGFGKQFTGTIRRLTYFPQRLSNANLQRITQ